MRMNNYVGDKFRTVDWIKFRALAKEILDKPAVALMNLKKCDVIMLSVGAIYIYGNNLKEALIKIIMFIQNNGNTNIMMLGILHRHNMVEYLYVNKEIQSINYKLKKGAKIFNYVSIMECNYNMEYFTKHGIHLYRKGKRLVSKQLTSEIWKLFATEEIPPISSEWKVIQEQVVSIHALVHEIRKLDNDHLKN
jgi:hypothetical protein